MNCPYCLSEVPEAAVVCKTCTKDLYLFKPMMAKVAELEKHLSEIPNQEAYEKRIAELELMLDEHEQRLVIPKTPSIWLLDIALYLVLPLLLLLFAHWLITVVYDTKMIYLRIISMILPLPFAYLLFRGHQHKLLPWFIGAAVLAISSVIGMSWITSLVDHSPIFPQSLFEWKEVIEYSASIAFSFLTGMLLGGVAYASKQRHRRAATINPFMKAVATGLAEGQMSASSIHSIMKVLQDYGGTIVALGTTALSIYTGLKGIIGS
jgi:hypothetical protein